MNSRSTTRKYLERHADAAASLAPRVPGTFGAALVVPLFDEREAVLDQLTPALDAAPDSVLLVLVVNSAVDSEPAAAARTLALWGALERRLEAPHAIEAADARGVLGSFRRHTVLLLDRANEPHRLPARSGVGSARRSGADLTIALHAEGRILAPFIGSSDGDATLPASYFETLVGCSTRTEAGARITALTFPYHHDCDDSELGLATARYEVGLRYYVLGLSWAGSPYAYESLGSALAFSPEAYAEAHGFPRLRAGEDFYLLDKLAKLGHVRRATGDPIRLQARASERVPFGTGVRSSAIALEPARSHLYDPRCFSALRAWLRVASRQAVAAAPLALEAELAHELGDESLLRATLLALAELGAPAAMQASLKASSSPGVRARRLRTWFDALRTLRFVHLVERAAPLPRLAIEAALERAPFVPEGWAKLPLGALRAALADAVGELPPDAGV